MTRDSVSAYVQMRRDTPFPLYANVRILYEPPASPHQLPTYLIDGPFLNRKTYKDIQISYSLNHKHSNKLISLRKSKW